MEHRLEFLHIPRGKTIAIAASGGPDSQALVDWCMRHTHRHVRVLFVHHRTETSDKSYELLHQYFMGKDIRSGECSSDLEIAFISRHKPKDKSWEEHWRDERYKILNSIEGNVLTAHNLDDAVETWVWSSLHGQSKLIPYRNGNILRPLLLTKKSTLKEWCDSHNVPYFIDPGNEDRRYMRSIVRHDILPHALKVNPGLYKVVKKKLLAEIKGRSTSSGGKELEENFFQ